MRIITNLLRALAVLAFVIIILINADETIKVSRTASAWLLFGACATAELAMLSQTVMNREKNVCRQNFGYKLMAVCLLFFISLALLFVSLL